VWTAASEAAREGMTMSRVPVPGDDDGLLVECVEEPLGGISAMSLRRPGFAQGGRGAVTFQRPGDGLVVQAGPQDAVQAGVEPTANTHPEAHTALMDRVRERVKDKRVLRLVKACLKAGALTEDNSREDTLTGTPQGGILSPLLAYIALSALDEHLTGPWEPGGEMTTSHLRRRGRAAGRPNCRVVRYADDFVVLTDGDRDDVEALREDIADVLQPLGLRLSLAKT
jgi:hypothetical protein